MDEKLKKIRHSLAHIMAEAVKSFYPTVKLAIGPVIENGFYYDFDFPPESKFSEADFPKIEKKMREIIKGNHPYIRKEVSKEEALSLFRDEPYKVELINDFKAGETITTYTQDTFTDLCRGGHVENTSEINAAAFALHKIAGAYWRGDSEREMLTRVYALAFDTPEELQNYLKKLEEAEKRDHRKLAVLMDLFHVDKDNPGQIFWHANGWSIYKTLENYIREKLRSDGYLEVNTPAIMPQSLWERSGHWAHYQKNMFITESEKRTFAIKPMNCPGAIEIFKTRTRSYKDLPLRLSEFGHCVRNEAGGTLHGIMRTRAFVQDDAHIFCTEEQIESEVAKFCRLLISIYKDFSFEKSLTIKLSTMPDDHVGDEATWRHAEDALKAACEAAGLHAEIQEGEGAFYGPKLEFTLTDALSRQWQCGTIQLDYQLPSEERLNAEYVGEDNKKHHPVMLHRAVLGSLERFLGILIEHYAGSFPVWLHFEQIAVVPVREETNDYARKIEALFTQKGFRAVAYTSSENMRSKIKFITKEHKTPYICVVGANEEVKNEVCVRFRGEKEQKTFTLEEFISYVSEKVSSHSVEV